MTDTPLIERLETLMLACDLSVNVPACRAMAIIDHDKAAMVRDDLREAIAILRGEADDLSSISDEALISEGARRRRAQITDEDRAWATASAEMIFGKDGKSDPDDLARVALDAIDRATKAEAELAILRGEGWRPIESAPRDGSYVDVWRCRPHADVTLGHRVPEVCWVANPENWIEPESPPGWYLEHDEEPLERVDGPEWKVSHFRPLPAPPEVGE